MPRRDSSVSIARSMFVLCAALWFLCCGLRSAHADDSGNFGTYIAAGRSIDLGTSKYQPTRYVGSHTAALIGHLSIESSAPAHTYGFGVGQQMISDWRSWATYENTGFATAPCRSWANCTQFERVCSMFGHVRHSYFDPIEDFASRYEESECLSTTNFSEHLYIEFAVASLRMRHTAACVEAHSPGECPVPEYLRWECRFSEHYPGTGEAIDYLHEKLPEEKEVWQEYADHLKSVDHGFFARDPAPCPDDSADVRFVDNRIYYYGPGNDLEHCDNLCNQGESKDHWEETNNVQPLAFTSSFESESNNLRVYAPSENAWAICLNEGGTCSWQPQTCSRRILPYSPPKCARMPCWCWAAATQAEAWNLNGLMLEQCDIVKVGLQLSTCPCEGAHLSEQARAWNNYSVPHTELDGLNFEDVQDEINSGTPIRIQLPWTNRDRVSHAMNIVGYDCVGGREAIYAYFIRDCASWSKPDSLPAQLKLYFWDDFKQGKLGPKRTFETSTHIHALRD